MGYIWNNPLATQGKNAKTHLARREKKGVGLVAALKRSRKGKEVGPLTPRGLEAHAKFVNKCTTVDKKGPRLPRRKGGCETESRHPGHVCKKSTGPDIKGGTIKTQGTTDGT